MEWHPGCINKPFDNFSVDAFPTVLQKLMKKSVVS